MVEGLRAGVGVTLRVAAYNARGRSDAIRFEVHTASAQQHAAPGLASLTGSVTASLTAASSSSSSFAEFMHYTLLNIFLHSNVNDNDDMMMMINDMMNIR